MTLWLGGWWLTAGWAQEEAPVLVEPVRVEPEPAAEASLPVAEVGLERPLAIPAPAWTAPTRAPPPEPDAQSRARQQFRAQSLSLRPAYEAYEDYQTVGWSPWGPRVVHVPRPFVADGSGLVVFQGGEPLDVPQTLQAIGDEQGLQALQQRILSNRRAGHAAYGLGALGIAGSLVGLMGLDRATTADQASLYGTVSAAGLGLMVGGFVAGTFPAGRAYRLQYDLGASQDLDALERALEAHNRELAAELGLDRRRARE